MGIWVPGSDSKSLLMVGKDEVRGHLDEVACQSVNDTLDGILKAEADRLYEV